MAPRGAILYAVVRASAADMADVSSEIMALEIAIKDKLAAAFRPRALRVVNESHLHAGHAGSPGGGESHFSVLVVADAFAGKTRLERHRLVNETLAEELSGGVHALAIRAMTPAEFDEARKLSAGQ